MAGTTNGVARPATVGQVLVLGYDDGATDGVLSLDGDMYRFDLLDETDNPAGVNARRYALRRLPADALDRLEAALAPHLSPNWPVWCPVWRFPDSASQQRAEASVDAVLSAAGPVEGELTTPDPHRFGTVRVGHPHMVESG